jgi:citrate synthase
MKDFLDLILPLCRLKGDHTALWEAVYTAQRASARTNASISKMLVNLVGQSSGSFIHAVTAGMMSTGEKHGPIAQARDDLLVYNTAKKAREAVQKGIVICGFGSSFYKEGPDPAWAEVNLILRQQYPETHHELEYTEQGIQSAGKLVYPNPAGYSAAAANAVGLLRGVEEAIFVMPRIAVWLREYIITQGGL